MLPGHTYPIESIAEILQNNLFSIAIKANDRVYIESNARQTSFNITHDKVPPGSHCIYLDAIRVNTSGDITQRDTLCNNANGEIIWPSRYGLIILNVNKIAYSEYPHAYTHNIHIITPQIPLHDPMMSMILPIPSNVEMDEHVVDRFFTGKTFDAPDIINSMQCLDDFYDKSRVLRYEIYWRLLHRMWQCSPNICLPLWALKITPDSMDNHATVPDLPNHAIIIRVLICRTIYARVFAILPEERIKRMKFLFNAL